MRLKLTTLIGAIAGALLALLITAQPVQSQSGPFGLGSVTLGMLNSCNPADGWVPGMMCQAATVSCLSTSPYNVNDISVTYGYARPTVGTIQGTIVILSGQGGTDPTNEISKDGEYASDYLNNFNYQVVMVKWGHDWEDTVEGGGGAASNVGYAACRPYTLLHYIWQTLFAGINNPNGGMCVQGESAGAAATAYTLAWYAGTSFIDKVELMSGPTLSRIDLGCQVPLPPIVPAVCPPSQFGCNMGTGSEWFPSVTYMGGAATSVREWAGPGAGSPVCAGGTTTTPAETQAWQAMSIVDGVHGTFNYPSTRMTGWLCSSVSSGVMNNSSGHGEQFYAMFTSGSQSLSYQLNDVQNCKGPEGVSDGTPPQPGFSNGMGAIEFDMANAQSPNRCQKSIRQ